MYFTESENRKLFNRDSDWDERLKGSMWCSLEVVFVIRGMDMWVSEQNLQKCFS